MFEKRPPSPQKWRTLVKYSQNRTDEIKPQDLGKNEVAASLQVISVLFDLELRESVKISEELKQLASKHLDKN